MLIDSTAHEHSYILSVKLAHNVARNIYYTCDGEWHSYIVYIHPFYQPSYVICFVVAIGFMHDKDQTSVVSLPVTDRV